MNRREFVRAAAAFPLMAAVPSVFSQEARPRSSGFREITPGQERAIERGLKYLAGCQMRSGGIGQNCQVAFTGLGGLAFLASGCTPRRGRYAENLRRAVRFILRCTSRRGYINEAVGRGMGGSGMHGHGYATLFLAEVYGMGGRLDDGNDEDIRSKLQLAVDLIEKAQDRNGGWTYEPVSRGHEGSVTITQVQALRAARNVGVKVDVETIRKGTDYIKKTTGSDGTVAYSLGMRGRGGSYALTAAGMCVFNYLGLHDAPELKRGMKALRKFLLGGRARGGGHQYYAHFYAAQAIYLWRKRDRDLWEKGYEKLRSELLNMQSKRNGGWENGGYGGAFGTACALCVLQVPYRMLSILQD